MPIDQMIDQVLEEQQLPMQNNEEEQDEFQVDLEQLVGPGEEGFPNHLGGGMQLPLNPNENELMQLADDHIQEQLGQLEAADMDIDQMQFLGPQEPNVHQAAPRQPEHDNQPQINNLNLQVGMLLCQRGSGPPSTEALQKEGI